MKFEEYPLHDSIRGWFGRALYFEMQNNPNIILITADLGWGLWDKVREDFPNQFINAGAAEQCALGAAIGMTLAGKTVFVYSITTFLLFRGFEWIRNYINHEKIPVRLVGSGFEDDYKHDGITHQPTEFELRNVFACFPNIPFWMPSIKEEIPERLSAMLCLPNEPSFLCLRR